MKIDKIQVENQEIILELNETSIYGLIYEPKSTNIDNDLDFYFRSCTTEVSASNFSLVSEKCRQHMSHGIVEIGVSRNGSGSFTQALLNNKPDEIIYLGVDLDDKTYLNDPTKKIFTIQENSFNREKVRDYMKEIGLDKISILLIDGSHSINAVINDWQYTEFLSDDGIVIFHDTNYHPGPLVLLKYIDPTIYRVEKYFEGQDDYGVAIAYKL